MSEQQQDTELTLGVGKLLGLFFLLVILCGVFFGLGYTLGKGSQKTEGSLIGDKTTAATDTKASVPLKPIEDDAKSQKADAKDSTESKKDAEEAKTPQPELTPTVTPGGAFVVQVAAVSKKEDAEALQQALQRKQYPVVVSPGAADKLFHVQIGPFADLKDAETMKGRLANDGYNAIVKK